MAARPSLREVIHAIRVWERLAGGNARIWQREAAVVRPAVWRDLGFEVVLEGACRALRLGAAPDVPRVLGRSFPDGHGGRYVLLDRETARAQRRGARGAK